MELYNKLLKMQILGIKNTQIHKFFQNRKTRSQFIIIAAFLSQSIKK